MRFCVLNSLRFIIISLLDEGIHVSIWQSLQGAHISLLRLCLEAALDNHRGGGSTGSKHGFYKGHFNLGTGLPSSWKEENLKQPISRSVLSMFELFKELSKSLGQ